MAKLPIKFCPVCEDVREFRRKVRQCYLYKNKVVVIGYCTVCDEMLMFDLEDTKKIRKARKRES